MRFQSVGAGLSGTPAIRLSVSSECKCKCSGEEAASRIDNEIVVVPRGLGRGRRARSAGLRYEVETRLSSAER